MESSLYEGTLRHRRFAAPQRDFEVSLFMAYLDLGELDSVFDGRLLWSTRAPNLAWFRRADHFGDPSVPLDESIRSLVEARTGQRPEGPIRLLTHLRYLGHCFNPVSFYYCFAKDGRTLETIVAEVANTPWNERHMYVLPEAANRASGDDDKRYEFPKAFHVSPFLAMDMDYGWRFGRPDDRLWVHMENRQKGSRVFEATLSLERRPLTGLELARTLVFRPAMTMKVVASIYSEALLLWLRRATFHPHPGNGRPEAS
jgi:DUF1365 family protein